MGNRKKRYRLKGVDCGLGQRTPKVVQRKRGGGIESCPVFGVWTVLNSVRGQTESEKRTTQNAYCGWKLLRREGTGCHREGGGVTNQDYPQ